MAQTPISNRFNGTKLPTDQQQLNDPGFLNGPFTPAGVFTDGLHDNLLKQKGFKATHYRHALSPDRVTVAEGVNVNAKNDAPGYRLYDPKEFFIVPQQLTWNDQYLVQGIHGGHEYMAVNHTGSYEGECEPRVYLRKGDLIVVKEGPTVLAQELLEFKPTGRQRLRFPIVEMDYIADTNNRYEQGADFNVVDGMIEWIGNRKPVFVNGRGTVLSVVYFTKPVFAVVSTPRVFRGVWSNSTGSANSPAQSTYLPGSAMLQMLWLTDSYNIEYPEWPTSLEPERTTNTHSNGGF